MLNDVLSLCVGLWAVKVAQQKTTSKYTYGWQRAETLGALVNGVFLVALCLSIFLEAIQRFVEPQEVSNPKLVLIVSSFSMSMDTVTARAVTVAGMAMRSAVQRKDALQHIPTARPQKTQKLPMKVEM
ncbi:hypothetical protein LTR28_005254 [Elasticomyces elasticus]|nr:hypothetical protein LTR28_005254 [Elasticomyces elasticus]